eukprot:8069998-Ditylum_brightwellii.AAC.1
MTLTISSQAEFFGRRVRSSSLGTDGKRWYGIGGPITCPRTTLVTLSQAEFFDRRVRSSSLDTSGPLLVWDRAP